MGINATAQAFRTARGVQGASIAAPRGRPPGRRNNSTLEAQNWAREVVRSKEYRESVKRRIENDTLPAAVEVLLNHYAFGKPLERVAIVDEREELVANMTDLELAERAEAAASTLRESHMRATAIEVNAVPQPDGEQ